MRGRPMGQRICKWKISARDKKNKEKLKKEKNTKTET